MKKILFLCSDTGGGPKTTAQAIISVLKKGGLLKTEIVDFLVQGNKTLGNIIKKFYSSSMSNNQKSLVYGFIYHITNNKLGKKIIRPLYKPFYNQINKLMLEKKPDALVVTHGLAGYLAQKFIENNQLQIPLIIVVADPISVHATWTEPKADLTIVATETAKDKCLQFGVPPSRIKVLGLPIRPEFYEKVDNSEKIRKKLGIKPGHTTLFTGGGDGGGNIYRIISELLGQKIDSQIIVVCGRNKKLQEKLSNLPIKVLGYTEKMNEIMSLVDLVVTKAGPGVIEETITKGLPIIIIDYIHGQEKANIKYAQKRTRAYFQPNPQKVAEIIKREIKGGLSQLKPISQKDAPVHKIAQAIVETL